MEIDAFPVILNVEDQTSYAGGKNNIYFDGWAAGFLEMKEGAGYKNLIRNRWAYVRLHKPSLQQEALNLDSFVRIDNRF